MTDKQKIEFTRELSLDHIGEDGDLVELDRSTLLVPGTHNGMKFPEDEIKNMDYSDSFPLNLDHSRSVTQEVGFWDNPSIEDGKLRADPYLNRQTAAFDAAMGYVQNRKAMDGTAEVSIEVYGVPDENEDGEEVLAELELDKASLVDRGAVSPDKGAGIGMNMDENFTWIIDGEEVECGFEQEDGTIIPVQNFSGEYNDNTTLNDLADFDWSDGSADSKVPVLEIKKSKEQYENGESEKWAEKNEEMELYVPNNPDNYDTSEADWEAPTLSDFTEDSFDDLSESEKREIAAHYAWSMNDPPENFGDLKLPHHAPSSGNVVKNGMEAAMAALNGARGGVEGIDDREAVYNHLKNHYVDDFGEDPEDVPELQSKDGEPEELDAEKIEVDREHYDELQSEVIELRNKVRDLEENIGEKWAEEIDNQSTARKTAVTGDKMEKDEKSLVKKFLDGEFGKDKSLKEVLDEQA